MGRWNTQYASREEAKQEKQTMQEFTACQRWWITLQIKTTLNKQKHNRKEIFALRRDFNDFLI